MTLPISGDGTIKFYDGKQDTSDGLKNVSIVTRIKNRKHHLLETLPTWLHLPVQEIVIVDWDSNDANLADYLNYIKDDRIKVVRVNNKRTFDRSAAWNLGIACASAEWAMLLDCDVKVLYNIFQDTIFGLPNYETFFRLYADGFMPHLYGCCIILKEQWEKVGGFNEDLEGWGWEDVDFFTRMRALYREVTLTLSHYEAINHSNDDRTAAHDEKDLRVSLAKNAYRCRNVESILIKAHDDGYIYQAGSSIKVAHYRQSVTYRKTPEQMREVMFSAKFAAMVKKYNVFTKPEEITNLFEMDEFLEFERKILQPTHDAQTNDFHSNGHKHTKRIRRNDSRIQELNGKSRLPAKL